MTMVQYQDSEYEDSWSLGAFWHCLCLQTPTWSWHLTAFGPAWLCPLCLWQSGRVTHAKVISWLDNDLAFEQYISLLLPPPHRHVWQITTSEPNTRAQYFCNSGQTVKSWELFCHPALGRWGGPYLWLLHMIWGMSIGLYFSSASLSIGGFPKRSSVWKVWMTRCEQALVGLMPPRDVTKLDDLLSSCHPFHCLFKPYLPPQIEAKVDVYTNTTLAASK